MCCIILSSSDSPSTDQKIWLAAVNNSDGAGLMYASKGKLEIRRGLWEPEEVCDEYWRALDAAEGGDVVLHVRMATQGSIRKENCHPFRVRSNGPGAVAIMHNGILDIAESDDITDSELWVRGVCDGRSTRVLMSDAFAERSEPLLGSYSKIVMMDNTGRVRILNEDLGTWQNDVWYSSEIERELCPFKKPAEVVETDGLFSKAAEFEDLIASHYSLANVES